MQFSEKPHGLKTFYTLDAERAGAFELSDEKAANDILRMFFMDFALDDARVELWALLKAALGDTGDYKPDHFIYFYERLCDMTIAAYVVASKTHSQDKAIEEQE